MPRIALALVLAAFVVVVVPARAQGRRDAQGVPLDISRRPARAACGTTACPLDSSPGPRVAVTPNASPPAIDARE